MPIGVFFFDVREPGDVGVQSASQKPRNDNEVLVSRRKISHFFARKPRKATSLAAFSGFDMKNFSWLRNCFAFQNKNSTKV